VLALVGIKEKRYGRSFEAMITLRDQEAKRMRPDQVMKPFSPVFPEAGGNVHGGNSVAINCRMPPRAASGQGGAPA